MKLAGLLVSWRSLLHGLQYDFTMNRRRKKELNMQTGNRFRKWSITRRSMGVTEHGFPGGSFRHIKVPILSNAFIHTSYNRDILVGEEIFFPCILPEFYLMYLKLWSSSRWSAKAIEMPSPWQIICSKKWIYHRYWRVIVRRDCGGSRESCSLDGRMGDYR